MGEVTECNLKMACKTCNRRHLLVLHDINDKAQEKTEKGEWRFQMVPSKTSVLNLTEEILYIDRPPEGLKVLLKVCKVILRNGTRALETFAILDDGSERNILLHPAAQQLGLQGEPEYLPIRTIRHESQVLQGAMVSFTIASAAEPHRVFQIKGAFTAKQLGLAEHTQPVETLQERYRHLKDLPLLPFKGACPALLIGSDHPHLITPVEPVRLGPPGGPAAIRTCLGWTLQGPAHGLRQHLSEQQCYFIATLPPPDYLYQ